MSHTHEKVQANIMFNQKHQSHETLSVFSTEILAPIDALVFVK